MNKEEIKKFLLERPGYLKVNKVKLAQKLKASESLISRVFKELKQKRPQSTSAKRSTVKSKLMRSGGHPSSSTNPLKTRVKKWAKENPKVKENQEKESAKILYWDLETSPNTVFSWNIGSRINLSIDNIVHERAIICVSYKWKGEKKVHNIQWKLGDDKELVQKFSKIIQDADISIGHNSDRFDLPWLRGRCIKHGVLISLKGKTIDTLKLSRKLFRLNSNKLDYLGKYLDLGKKQETGYGLWKDIVLKNDKIAMNKMVNYCNNDVKLLEKVHNKIDKYIKKK